MLVLALCTGFSHFQTEYDVKVLYTPDNARSKDELSVVRRLFANDDSVLRMTTLGEYGRVIVTAKGGGNVLAENVFREVEQLDRDIRAITVHGSGSTFNYSSLCTQTDGSCSEDALLRLRKDMGVDPKTVSYPVHKGVAGAYGNHQGVHRRDHQRRGENTYWRHNSDSLAAILLPPPRESVSRCGASLAGQLPDDSLRQVVQTHLRGSLHGALH